MKFVQAYARGRRAGRLPHGAERAAEPHARAATPARTCRSPQQAKVIEALGPLLRRRQPAHEDPRRTTTTGRPTPTTSPTPRPGEDPETDYPYQLLRQPGGEVDRRHRVPLLLRRPERADRPARRVPGQGHLVHRVLRLARRRRHRRRSSSATRSPGTPAPSRIGTTRNWAKSVGQLEHRARLAPAARTSAAATPAPAWSRCSRTAPSPPTPSTTRSATCRSSCGPARSASPARRSARPAGTARSWTSRSATRTAPPRSSCTTRTTTRGRSRWRSATESFEYTLPGGALATFTWPRIAGARRRPRAGLRSTGATATRRPRPPTRRWPSTRTPRPAGPAARPRSPASTCRSTSARATAVPPGRDRQRRQPRRLRPRLAARASATTAPRWRVIGDRHGHRPAHQRRRRPDPRPLPADHRRPAAPATGGASPTCGSTADRLRRAGRMPRLARSGRRVAAASA